MEWHGPAGADRLDAGHFRGRIPALVLKARLFEVGPEITRKEWFVCVGMLVLIMLGTINIRMAEMKARRQGTLPLIDPEARFRK